MMPTTLIRLRRDSKGVGAVEFALVAPVLLSFIFGVAQMGRLFFANADMKNAVAAGARAAELYPTPLDPVILAAVNDRLVRTGAEAKANASVVHGTDGNGNPYVEIRMTYTVPLDFIFFSVGPVSLTDTRRVFTQVESANSTSYAGSTGSTSGGTAGSTTSTTGGTTGSTTTGGTTTSSTTTGGTTTGGTTTGGTTSSTTSSTGGTTSTSSTSSTSASSTGGTSATSASSTSSTTSSTTSSSGNASSGNASSGNNGSSGHAHGDCKKC